MAEHLPEPIGITEYRSNKADMSYAVTYQYELDDTHHTQLITTAPDYDGVTNEALGELAGDLELLDNDVWSEHSVLNDYLEGPEISVSQDVLIFLHSYIYGAGPVAGYRNGINAYSVLANFGHQVDSAVSVDDAGVATRTDTVRTPSLAFWSNVYDQMTERVGVSITPVEYEGQFFSSREAVMRFVDDREQLFASEGVAGFHDRTAHGPAAVLVGELLHETIADELSFIDDDDPLADFLYHRAWEALDETIPALVGLADLAVAPLDTEVPEAMWSRIALSMIANIIENIRVKARGQEIDMVNTDAKDRIPDFSDSKIDELIEELLQRARTLAELSREYATAIAD